MSSQSPPEAVAIPQPSILLLGEGDFSFAYDLARFIVTNICEKKPQDTPILHHSLETSTHDSGGGIKLIATGIDSPKELHAKYKDATFFVSKLESLGSPSTASCPLNVGIHYEINAILPLKKEATPTKLAQLSSSHVIFNHPHLGVEDASLHGQFLSHLFHSVVHGWMLQDGWFYLTLIVGQWERWEGAASAEKFGLELVDRSVFQSPTAFQDESPYYQQRRHQSGRSFASRAEAGSETFTFRRKTRTKVNTMSCENTPFWTTKEAETAPSLSSKVKKAKTLVNQSQESMFVCKECHKAFREERSLNSHFKGKHGTTNGVKRKRESFACSKCDRAFESSVGLQDHMVAKHSGPHSDIKPDWLSNNNTSERSSQDNSLSFCCPICSVKAKDALDHMQQFIPVLDGTYDVSWSFSCAYCHKKFRELRAQRQHENFCSNKLQHDTKDATGTVMLQGS